jgi:hypothetical protein
LSIAVDTHLFQLSHSHQCCILWTSSSFVEDSDYKWYRGPPAISQDIFLLEKDVIIVPALRGRYVYSTYIGMVSPSQMIHCTLQ